MIDGKKRTLAKAISWRIVAFIVLCLVSWALLGSITAATTISAAYSVVQVFIYFQHERLWNYIKWGKTKGAIVVMTGMSGAGKTTLSKIVSKKLKSMGHKVEVIDGDQYRNNISKDLGFTHDNSTNNTRITVIESGTYQLAASIRVRDQDDPRAQFVCKLLTFN